MRRKKLKSKKIVIRRRRQLNRELKRYFHLKAQLDIKKYLMRVSIGTEKIGAANVQVH